MKKLFLALVALSFCLLLALFPSPAQALCDNGLTGPKIAGNMDDSWLRAIRQEYDKANPGCQGQEIPVTILLQKGAITGRGHTLATMKSLNLKPIIRLASSGSSTGWARITPAEARQMAADVSQIISQAGIVNPIVYFGNEPNLPAEWGGQADAINFAQSFAAFIQAAGPSRNFQIFSPPVSTHQGGAEYNFMTQVLNYPVSGSLIGDLVDGAALTIYHDNPASINKLFQELRTFYAHWGITNLFISEVGPLVNGELQQKICQLRTWQNKMTEFFQNQPITGVQGINTSFFADLDCDGDPDFTYLAVIDETGEVKVFVPYDSAGNADPLEKWYADKGRADELELENCCVAPRKGVNVISGASTVCADFTAGTVTTTETGGTPTPTPEEGNGVLGVTSSLNQFGGQLFFKEGQFPDFSQLGKSLAGALKRLLPSQLGQTISLPGETKIPLVHFIQGKGEGATATGRGNSPASELKVPADLWGEPAGAIAGLCAFLGTCQPVSNFQFELAEAGEAGRGACPAGQAVKPADLPAPTTKRADFSIKGIIEIITEIIGNLTRTTKKKEVQVATAGQLAGGEETRENAKKLFDGYLPEPVIQTIAGQGALSESFRYDIAFSPGEEQIESGQFLGLASMRAAYCLNLCGRLPTEIDVSSVDPLCPSCNPESYKPVVSLEDVPLDTSWCHADSNGACNYYKCKIGVDPGCEASRGCGPDQAPICESDYCNPLEWRQAKDYTNQGCPIPYDAPDCSAVCAKQTFAENKQEGGYGHCRYTNATVCVRQDRVATRNCAALCNWACCQ